MPQQNVWENEYKKPQLIQLSDEPRKDLLEYIKFLRKKESITLEGLHVLDLGSGNGKNANYLAGLGCKVTGFEISLTALKLAQAKAAELAVDAVYHQADIGTPFAEGDNSFDLVIDIMSSNSLDEHGREVYLKEVHRVLKPEGHFFVRALCKDGDKNAKNLIKLSPGKEDDTYINKDMNLVERVFSKADFIKTYAPHFEIQELIQKTNYAQFKRQSYKRNYWLAYMKKA